MVSLDHGGRGVVLASVLFFKFVLPLGGDHDRRG
jgi:hypothetical protein